MLERMYQDGLHDEPRARKEKQVTEWIEDIKTGKMQ